MNRKLAVRNVMGLAKDYLVYFLTMTFVTALMFAFNSILFSKDVQNMFEVAGAMAAMVGLATFFVVLIVAWLIHYMVRFIMEKRSREFGIYLLIGMKKKEIAGLYMRENLLLGIGAFLPGMGLGILIQQILMSVLYGMIQGQLSSSSGDESILYFDDAVMLWRLLSVGAFSLQTEISENEYP